MSDVKILLTGAAGFVGSHAVRHILMNTDWEIVAPVSFNHKGLPERIQSSVCDLDGGSERVQIIHWDMRSPASLGALRAFEGTAAIWNIASESHVDRSIADPLGFISNNTLLELNILDVARKIQPGVFLQMSTDEVYGPAAGDYRHHEWDVIAPSNPYAASKAAQEAIAFSYWRTYDVPVVITNTMNIVGEMQDPEKFLPMIIRNIRADKTITVHASPTGEPGSRFYLHARNLADGWLFLTFQTLWGGLKGYGSIDTDMRIEEALTYSLQGRRPMRFNIVGEQELKNNHLVQEVARIMGKSASMEYVSFHASRPGHDLRYALEDGKLEGMGWRPPVELIPSLEKTVRWYLDNPGWLDMPYDAVGV